MYATAAESAHQQTKQIFTAIMEKLNNNKLKKNTVLTSKVGWQAIHF